MSNNHNFKNLRELFQQKYGVAPAPEIPVVPTSDRKLYFSKPQSKNQLAQVMQDRQTSKLKSTSRQPSKGRQESISPALPKSKPTDLLTDRPRQSSFHQQSPVTLSQFQSFFQFQQLKQQLEHFKQQRLGSQEKSRPQSGKNHKSPPQQQVKVVQVHFPQGQSQMQFSIHQQKRSSASSAQTSQQQSVQHTRNSSAVHQQERDRSPASSHQKFINNFENPSPNVHLQVPKSFDLEIKLELPNKSDIHHYRYQSNQIETKKTSDQTKQHQVDLIEKLIQNQKDQQKKQKIRFKNEMKVADTLFEQVVSQHQQQLKKAQIQNFSSVQPQYPQENLRKSRPPAIPSASSEQSQEEDDEVRIVDNYHGVIKSNFIFHYVIGKGGFGKVWKVELKKNRVIYAMKEMSKAKIISKRSVNSVMNEKQLLSELNHNFLVNMTCAFQDRENLYLVMDLLTGGDLRFHIGKMRRFKEHQTKFFVGCILLALEYLHNNNIIHRDLKPENLVLDAKGFVRLTDLGIARVWKSENSADTSGTPGYMAPEVMCHQNHGIAVDYFALGVIAYEFMLGRRPYQGRSRKEIREQILAKQVQIKKHEIPDDWSLDAADFINRLIQRKPANRLGFNGPEEVKNHPWLKNFPWARLFNKEVDSPYIPISIDDNYEYLNQISEDNDSQDEVIQQNVILLRKNSVQNLFAGYSYEFNSSNIQSTGKATKSTASTHSTGCNQHGEARYYQP